MRLLLPLLRSALAVAVLAPVAARAQQDSARVVSDSGLPSGAALRSDVGLFTGVQAFAHSAAMRSAPVLGVRFTQRLRQYLNVGVSLGFAQPETRGDFFPWNRQVYANNNTPRNDTTLIFEVSQRTTLATYLAEVGTSFGGRAGTGRAGLGRPWVEANVGVGGYTFWLDPEQTHENRAIGAIAYALGGGVGLPVGATGSLRLRVEDLIFTIYDRDRFSLSDPLVAEDLWPNPRRDLPAKQDVIHNPRFTVTFSFVPGQGAR